MGKYNICFIDMERRVNGVTTFKSQLMEIFRNCQGFNFIIISASSVFDIGIETYDYLKSLDRLVILSNSWPASPFIENIRQAIPNCRIIQIVHDLPWLTIFAGNLEAFLISFNSGFPNFDERMKKFLYYSTLDCIKTFKLCDNIVCLCEDTVKVINECYDVPLSKINMIRNGLIEFKSPCGYKHQEIFNKDFFNILFIGRQTYSKGWDRVIELGNLIKENDYPMRIITVGSNMKYEMNPQDHSDYIITLGELTREDIHSVMLESDAVFIPSRHEQCSYVGIEAMMHSKEIFTYGGYGLDNMFSNENAHIITDLGQIGPNVEPLGYKARKIYESLYCFEKMQQSYIDLILLLF